ncbi:MAG: transposase [Candidatus Binatia bacterium]
MAKQRRRYSGELKAKVVLEVLKGQRTVNEIASRFGVHPVQVFQWKKQAVEELARVFADRRGQAERAAMREKAELFEQIGRLKMELEWLKKSRRHRVTRSADGSTGIMAA